MNAQTRRFLALVLAGAALCLSGPARAVGASAGAGGFFVNRSAEEVAALDRGEIIVGKLADWRAMGLGAAGVHPDALRARIAALKPNYVTEFMAVAPSDSLSLERLDSALRDVEGYLSVPYLSKRYNQVLPFFDKMTITSRKASAGGETIETRQHMLPFEDFDARYDYSLAGDELSYWCQNLSELKYSGFSAVRPGNMIWSLYARRVGDRCYVYGIGATRAFDALGVLRARLEMAIDGRVESFMRYMFAKMGPEAAK